MNAKSRPERKEEKQEEATKPERFYSQFVIGQVSCPNLRSPLLAVAHREYMTMRACIIGTTSIPENRSYEN